MRILIVLLFVAVGVLGYLYYQETQGDVTIELNAPEIE